MCLCLGCGGVGGEWVGGLDQGLEGWCGVMSVCVVSLDFCGDDRSRCLYIVLGGYLRIVCVPSVKINPVEDIANPDLFVCCCRTWISLDFAHL